MRAILTWILALGLAVTPALAGTEGTASKDSTATNAAESSSTAGSSKASASKNGAASAPAATPKSDATAKPETTAKLESSSLEMELQQLRELIVSQTNELEATREQLKEQQKQLHALEEQVKRTGADSLSISGSSLVSAPKGTPASTGTISEVGAAPSAAQPGAIMPKSSGAQDTKETSPLQFRIGSAYITPIGFMDFTGEFRSKDGGSGIGTNFAGIPYGNVFQNNLSEFRFSMQNSRIGFRVDAEVKGAHVIGYMESDYLGNNPGNVAVSSNSNTMRSRLYWVDVQKDKWEVLGGQTWSLITPGRTGISPLPGNLFFTQNIDVNYQLGLVWGRIPEVRFVYHPSAKAALAVALDSPEQYIGGSAGGGLITFPAALAGVYSGGELNNGGSTLGVPNRGPDVIAKLALDPSKKFHVEVGGIVRQFQLFNPTTTKHFSATGGGGFVNLNFELFKGFRLLTNNFWSDGGGRYIFGQAPDLIVRADGSPSLIHSGSTVTGFEYTNKNSLIYAYYGALYVGRNTAFDANGTTRIGYGFTGSPNGQNRSVQEATVGFAQAFWKDAKYGALTFMGQYSYLTRDPWFIASGQPKNAHLSMVFLNLRYTLPGSAPAMK